MSKEFSYKPRETYSVSFAEEIKRNIPPALLRKHARSEKTEPLALFEYGEELRIKQTALAAFLRANSIKIKPEPLIGSPRPRKYRTTSKRKVFESRGKFFLLFADESYITKPDLFRSSLLEPDEHAIIFEYLCGLLNQPGYTFLARALNFIIIRGNYEEFSVIFNISKINADVIRKLKTVASKFNLTGVNIISSFTYYDPTKSEYYFESERPEKEVTFKKLFGPDFLFLKLKGKKFSYHPTSFSQINASIIPALISKTEQLLNPDGSGVLYDLYCGYGLFACSFAGRYKEITGIEASGESIKSALLNAKYLSEGTRIRFAAKKITEDSLLQTLPAKIKENEVFLLDPPRNGAEKGVIKTIAEREPGKIIHIFCCVDEIPEGIAQWEKEGYKLKSLSPLDLFPGSPNLEVIALLEK